MTRREAEVLAAVADRLTNAEIAVRLFISERTVESHVSALLRKLGVRDRRALAALAKQTAASHLHSLPTPLDLLADSRTYVGRSMERTRLTSLWTRCAAGQSLVVLIEAEAGMGKSRLVAELACEVAAQSAHVLYGACFEDPLMPYQGFSDAISKDVEGIDRALLVRRLGAEAAALARVAPVLGTRLALPATGELVDPTGERSEIHAALTGYLRRRAESGPVLVVLEDLHWAPPSTRHALLSFARSAEHHPILMVATTRHTPPDIDGAFAKYLAELGDLPVVVEMELGGLNQPETARLLELAGGATRADPRSVQEQTGGNPLFIRELATSRADGPVPSTTKLLQRRFSLLDDVDLEAVDLAAVLGAEFDAELLARILARPLLDVLASLERAESAGLIVASPGRPGIFMFVHPLFRSVRYDTIGYRRRLQLHHQVAQVLDSGAHEPQLLTTLARHACAAAPIGDARRGFDLAVRAGALAEQSLALEEAAGQYRLALQVADRLDDSTAQDVLGLRIRLGQVMNRIGDPEHRTVLLEAAETARRLDNAVALAQIAWALTQYGTSQSPGSSDQSLVEIANEALRGIGPQPTAIRARTLAALAADLAVGDDPALAFDLITEALSIARGLGDPVVLGMVLLTYRWAARTPENLEARHPTADALISIGHQTGQAAFTVLGMVNRAMSLREEGKLDACDQVVDEYATIIGDRPFPPNIRSQLIMFQAMRGFLAGDLAEADRIISKVLDLPATGGFQPMRFYGAGLFVVRHAQGRLDEVIELLESAGRDRFPVLRALAYGTGGRLEDARSVLRTLIRAGFATDTKNPMWLGDAIHLCEIAEMTGEVSAARALVASLEPYSGRLVNGLVVDGPVDLAIAQAALAAGDCKRADDFATRAADAARVWRTPLYLGRALLIRAKLDQGRGNVFAEEALEICERHKMGLIQQDAARFAVTSHLSAAK